MEVLDRAGAGGTQVLPARSAGAGSAEARRRGARRDEGEGGAAAAAEARGARGHGWIKRRGCIA